MWCENHVKVPTTLEFVNPRNHATMSGQVPVKRMLLWALLACHSVGGNVHRFGGRHPPAYCWDDDIYLHTQHRLTRGMCMRSIKNIGDPLQFLHTVNKSKHGGCLQIAILGGSITLGGPMTKIYSGGSISNVMRLQS